MKRVTFDYRACPVWDAVVELDDEDYEQWVKLDHPGWFLMDRCKDSFEIEVTWFDVEDID